MDRGLQYIARHTPFELDLRNCFIEHRDKLAGAKRGGSEAPFTVPECRHPPATLFHGVEIEQRSAGPIKQINQRKETDFAQPYRAKH